MRKGRYCGFKKKFKILSWNVCRKGILKEGVNKIEKILFLLIKLNYNSPNSSKTLKEDADLFTDWIKSSSWLDSRRPRLIFCIDETGTAKGVENKLEKPNGLTGEKSDIYIYKGGVKGWSENEISWINSGDG